MTSKASPSTGSDELVERVALAVTKALAISHGLKPELAEKPVRRSPWVRDGFTAARAALNAIATPDTDRWHEGDGRG